MIAEALAFLFDPAPRALPPPAVVEARQRRRVHKTPSPSPGEGASLHKVQTFRIIQRSDGSWMVIQRGIEDVYDAVPPFNRSKP